MSWFFSDQVRRPSLRRTLLASNLSLVVLAALVFAGTGAFFGLQMLLRNTYNQLSVVADLKQQEIERWVEEREDDLAVLASDVALQRDLQKMLSSSEQSHEQRTAYSDVAVRLSSFLRKKVAFVEFYLMDPETSEVMVSTDLKREGETYYLATHFRKGLEGPYIQPPTFDTGLRAPAMLIARPLEGEDGKLLAVLIGRANLSDLGTSIQTSAGLGETEETYLVNEERRYLAGTQRPQAMPEGPIRSEGIRAALQGEEGVRRYSNYRDEKVFGAYRWLPRIRIALLVEQRQTEATLTAFWTGLAMVGATILGVLLASGASLLLTRRIVDPIVELTEAATEIAAGDLRRTAPVTRADEIGALAQAFNSMTTQLRELIGSLEQRVTERTRDLERRALELEAAAHVAREAAAIQDVKELMDETVHLISVLFGFYHAGIFLLDDAEEYAVLQAASSEGGRRMLARQHRLKVGEEGIVGYVAHYGTSRIALDVGEDAVFFDNPDLPQTRSEMALPLAVRGQVIGVLDVQSTEAKAFSDEDVAVLQTMADQLAVAIENARLLEGSRNALRELEILYGKQTREAWREQTARRVVAFRYTGVDVEPVSDGTSLSPTASERHPPFERRTSDAGEEDGQRLAVPIRLRGQTLGTITLQRDPEEEPWTAEEIALLDEVSTQIGLALENARLLEETRQRARQEQIIANITARVRSSLDPETILQTAVRELGAALGTDRAFVHLGQGEPDDGRDNQDNTQAPLEEGNQ